MSNFNNNQVNIGGGAQLPGAAKNLPEMNNMVANGKGGGTQEKMDMFMND